MVIPTAAQQGVVPWSGHTPSRAVRSRLSGAPAPYTPVYVNASITNTRKAQRGLHKAVVREIERNNPHAVFPLIRAWVEAVTIGLYVLRKPTYGDYLLNGPGNSRPAKKSVQAMFHAVKDDAEQLDHVYRQLSDYTHFGSLAVWNAYSIEHEDLRTVSWTDAPRLRDTRHFQIARVQVHELGVAGLETLDRLGALLIPISQVVRDSFSIGFRPGCLADPDSPRSSVETARTGLRFAATRLSTTGRYNSARLADMPRRTNPVGGDR